MSFSIIQADSRQIPLADKSVQCVVTSPPYWGLRDYGAGCPVGGIVLDPFGGAGTTALVADKLGRHGIGLELKRDYCEMAYRRCFNSAPMLSFIND